MPNGTQDTGRTSIPASLSIANDLQPSIVEYKNLSKDSIKVSEVGQINQVYINETHVLTSLVSFIRGIQKNFASGSYPANALFYYAGDSQPVVTGSATALYELLRGYLYRDVTNSSVSSITSVIQSKTSTSALTGFRMVMFDRSLKADTIKPNSFRLSITPYKTAVQKPTAIFLSNSAITNNSSTGAFVQIAGVNSLLGSLSTGTVGSTLTGFTVRMTVRPRPGGPPIQTLFHRRVADFALTTLDWFVGQAFAASISDVPAIDDSIVLWKYGSLNSFNTALDTSTINFGTFNYLTYVIQGDSYLNSFSATFRVANIGGAQVFFSATSNTNGLATNVDPTGTFKPASYPWLSLCSALTSSVLKSTNNYPYMFSTPMTAYVNSNILRYTAAYGAGINVLGGNAVVYNQPNILQKARDLPISLPIVILAF